MYRPSKLITALLVFVCFAMNCYGQYGCLVDPAGSAGRFTVSKIYVNQQAGASTNPIRFFSNSAPYDISCPAGATRTTVYASNVSDYIPNTQCFVEYKGTGSTTQPGNYWQNGKLVNFRVANCPIDDYIPHLLLLSSLVAVIALRRRV